MSITVLTQVYDEARRLAVAGSVVARGDFRLKKLIAPLEQAGAKAPVFAKVAESAKAVVEGSEEASAANLLELTSLVTAVLYTQGETGAAGELKPIETTDLGGTMAQTSARLLKPLLEALRSTGSGRLEIVKEAHQRGAFRDLRLVRPALDGVDDPYPEVADFLADDVLPMYGTAILPELRAKFDPKGTKGHPRRLKLLHRLDPAGTRELVKQALEAGSKDVKVAAISCLGADKEDLSFLVEQSAAKAQDVRGAAYEALAKIDDPAAVAVLAKAIAGKDLGLATAAIRESTSDKLTDVIVAEIQKECAALLKLKDKKQVSEKADRVTDLIRSLPHREHAAADALILDQFAHRAELAKAKGTAYSGSDVVAAVIVRMANGPKPLQRALAAAHPTLEADQLRAALGAARSALPANEVYEEFGPYLTAGIAGKKDKTAAKREAVVEGLGGVRRYYWWYSVIAEDQPPLDPRWLDLAVRIKDISLIRAVGRPGHRDAEQFLQEEFDRQFRAVKSQDDLMGILSAMVRLQHPGAADAVLKSYWKAILKPNANTYWYYHLIPLLPKTAIPVLESFVTKLKDSEADRMLEAIQELRDKKDTPQTPQ